MSYNCNICDGGDVTAVRHAVAVKAPCTRCMGTEENSIGGRMTSEN